MKNVYTQMRAWKSSHDLFLAKLDKINRKRPIGDPMSGVELFDLLVKGKAPEV